MTQNPTNVTGGFTLDRDTHRDPHEYDPHGHLDLPIAARHATFRSRAATDHVKSTLRQARELAISSAAALLFSLWRTTPFNCSVWNRRTPSLRHLLDSAPRERCQFMTFSGETDTPDSFGIPRQGDRIWRVAGGPTTGMQFQSDGTFTTVAATPINGTVFLVRRATTLRRVR